MTLTPNPGPLLGVTFTDGVAWTHFSPYAPSPLPLAVCTGLGQERSADGLWCLEPPALLAREDLTLRTVAPGLTQAVEDEQLPVQGVPEPALVGLLLVGLLAARLRGR